MAQIGTDEKHCDLGNTKRSRARNYMFTWNNYTKEDVEWLVQYLGTNGEYLFQEETGEQGTKHLQGVVFFKNPAEFKRLKNDMPKCHLEVCKKRDAAIQYCSKRETRSGEVFTNMKIKIRAAIRDPMEGLALKPWQEEILSVLKQEPDPRKIYWIWSLGGGTGKSTFAKHLCLKYGALCVSGKANDIKFAIMNWLEEQDLKIIIMDVPRTNLEFVSYQALEEIKNGLFFCGKYESKQVIFNPPHLFVYANAPPERCKVSEDRWQVIKID